MATGVITVLVGASIIKALKDHLILNEVKNLAIGGLTFTGHKMEELKRKFVIECRSKKTVKIVLHPLGNDFFPGRPRGKCYMAGKKPLTVRAMAIATIKLISELRALLPRDTISTFTLLPGLGRRRNRCLRTCKYCIPYTRFASKLAKFEKFMCKANVEDLTVISISQFSAYLQKTSTRKIRRRLEQNDHRLLIKKVNKFSNIRKSYSVISGMLLRCSLHRQKKYAVTDYVHTCCKDTKMALANFIYSIL